MLRTPFFHWFTINSGRWRTRCFDRITRLATLDPTELVHEAYLKLVRHDAVGDLERTHFFRLAARAMRQVLCDHAAARRTAKRGGDWARVDLTIAEPASPERLGRCP